jgi:predicted nucleic acid-binding protein
MSDFIIDSDGVKYLDFNQASIAVDACFLLAYLDADDPRGDKVSVLLDKWSNDKISELVITNKVAAETIHNLFKNNIRDVLYLIHKMNTKRYRPNPKELEIIGDLNTARNLTKYVPRTKLDELVIQGELYYNIGNILKDFKANEVNREGLHTYYNHAVETFQGTIRDLSIDLNINVTTPNLDNIVIQETALSIMRIQQLDVFDAFHIASSTLNGCNYFATLDSDFIHTYYSNDSIGYLKILKVA